MNLWKSLEGIVTVRLISADISGVLDHLAKHGIEVERVQFEDALTAVLTLPRGGYTVLRSFAEKRGETIHILRRKGLYWTFSAAKKRPLLMMGVFWLLVACLYLPTRVLFIRVEGNSSVPARQILAAAEECGIRFGASRREVRSEKMKNALLGALPQLKWAGVNTSGCVATISVRERTDTVPQEPGTDVSSLVAARDGIIVSCTVTDGSARCVVGQAVKEGQVLVSAYTDCGILLKATRAEGEIMAQTRHRISAVTLPERIHRGSKEDMTRSYSLIVGKKRINLWNSSGICDAACGRMYEEYYITLPGGFVLPVALAVDTHTCYEASVESRNAEEAYEALTAFCERYVCDQMVSGTILDAALSAETGNDSFRIEADYLCMEMIGVRRQERKVEENGKSD